MLELPSTWCCLPVQSRPDETRSQQRVGLIDLLFSLLSDWYRYIKELAERLHTLENQMQPAMVHPDMQYQAMNEVSPPRPYQEFSPPIDTGSINRKRTYSVFEGLPSSFSQPPFNPRGSQNAFGMYPRLFTLLRC